MHAVVNESLAPTLNCLLRIKREAEPKKQWHRCKARLSIDAAMASLAGSRQDMRDECRADSRPMYRGSTYNMSRTPSSVWSLKPTACLRLRCGLIAGAIATTV